VTNGEKHVIEDGAGIKQRPEVEGTSHCAGLADEYARAVKWKMKSDSFYRGVVVD